ncbi:hypothetical protein Tco_1354996 [Tanacetum coccineum]
MGGGVGVVCDCVDGEGVWFEDGDCVGVVREVWDDEVGKNGCEVEDGDSICIGYVFMVGKLRIFEGSLLIRCERIVDEGEGGENSVVVEDVGHLSGVSSFATDHIDCLWSWNIDLLKVGLKRWTQFKILPPRNLPEEIVPEKERKKSRITLLKALLTRYHLAKFLKMTDAKEIRASKGYDRFPKALLSLLEIHGAGVSTVGCKAKISRSLSFCSCLWSDVKALWLHSSSPQNVAFISENTSSTNDVSTAYCVPNPSGQNSQTKRYKFLMIVLDDKTDVLTYHKKLLAEAQKEKEDLKAKVEKWHNSSKNLSKLLNTQMSANDKFGLGYGDHIYDGILSYENEVLQSVFMNKERFPHRALKNKGIVDSGCSRHMTGNKAYLAEFQDFNGGPVAFGGDKREYSIEEPPKQYGVAERKEQDLIEVRFRDIKLHPCRSTRSNHHAGTKTLLMQGILRNTRIESAQECFGIAIWLIILQKDTPGLKTQGEKKLMRKLKLSGRSLHKKLRTWLSSRELAKASSTNLVNTVSIPVSTASPNEGLSLSDSTNPEQDDSEIPPFEDIYQNSSDRMWGGQRRKIVG